MVPLVFGNETVRVCVGADVDAGGDASEESGPEADVGAGESEPPVVGLDVGGEDDAGWSDFFISSEVADSDGPEVAEPLPHFELDLAFELVAQNDSMKSCVVAFEAKNVTRIGVAHSVHILRPAGDRVSGGRFTHTAFSPQDKHLVNHV